MLISLLRKSKLEPKVNWFYAIFTLIIFIWQTKLNNNTLIVICTKTLYYL